MSICLCALTTEREGRASEREGGGGGGGGGGEKVVGKGMQQAEKDKCHRLLVLVQPC